MLATSQGGTPLKQGDDAGPITQSPAVSDATTLSTSALERAPASESSATSRAAGVAIYSILIEGIRAKSGVTTSTGLTGE
jgi:hypothetical protein